MPVTIDHSMQVQQILVASSAADLVEVELYDLNLLGGVLDAFFDYVEEIGYDVSTAEVVSPEVVPSADVLSMSINADLRFSGPMSHVPPRAPKHLTVMIHTIVARIPQTLHLGRTVMNCCSHASADWCARQRAGSQRKRSRRAGVRR